MFELVFCSDARFCFCFVVQVQVDPDKPRDLVVLNLDWSTREWELREYFEVGVSFLGIINI